MSDVITNVIFENNSPIFSLAALEEDLFAFVCGEVDAQLKIVDVKKRTELYSYNLGNWKTNSQILLFKNDSLFFLDNEVLNVLNLKKYKIEKIEDEVLDFIIDDHDSRLIFIKKNGAINYFNILNLEKEKSLSIHQKIQNNPLNKKLNLKLVYDHVEKITGCFLYDSLLLLDEKGNIKNSKIDYVKNASFLNLKQSLNLLVIIGANLKGIVFFDIKNNQVVNVTDLMKDSIGYNKVVFSPFEDYFLLSSRIGFLAVINLKTGHRYFSKRIHDTRIRDLIFANDNYYTCGDDGKIIKIYAHKINELFDI